MKWLSGDESEDEVIKEEELEGGFNPCRTYPFHFIVNVINYFDNTGILLVQDEAMRYDPAYLADVSRAMRWRRVTRKEAKNDSLRAKHSVNGDV